MDRAIVALAVCAGVGALAFALRRLPSALPARVEPAELGLGGAGVGVVEFSSRFCLLCQAWDAALQAAGVEFVKVDVGERPGVARRYRVLETPLVLAVDLPGGRVLASYVGEPRPGEVERLRVLAGAPPPP